MAQHPHENHQPTIANPTPSNQRDTATFGGGCYWCIEAVMQRLRGVDTVRSGFAGGHVPNPTYREVCTGNTGHAEVVQVVFDPAQISYEDLLYVFFRLHDPTTLNRQGNDVGTQYRSVIFYHDEQQRQTAEAVKRETELRNVWTGRIVTEITPFDKFYPAEDYHQNYYNENGEQPYCRLAIDPKIQKLQKDFKAFLKQPG